jgi:hypothetical protein
MGQWWLWPVIAAIPLVQGLYWLLLVRMDHRERARTRALPSRGRLFQLRIFMVVNFISNLALLTFTLAHLGGPIGTAFAWVPLNLTHVNWFTLLVGSGMLLFGFEIIFVAAGALVELGAAVGFVRFPQQPAASPTEAEP